MSLVHYCAIKKTVIVASQLYDVADVQFTVVKEGILELFRFIQKYNLGNSVPNIAILLRIFLTVSISVATCEKSFSKLKLIKNYLRSSMSALRLRNLATLSIDRHTIRPVSAGTVPVLRLCPDVPVSQQKSPDYAFSQLA